MHAAGSASAGDAQPGLVLRADRQPAGALGSRAPLTAAEAGRMAREARGWRVALLVWTLELLLTKTDIYATVTWNSQGRPKIRNMAHHFN